MRKPYLRFVFLLALLSCAGCFVLFDFAEFDADRPVPGEVESGAETGPPVVPVDAATPFDLTLSVTDPVVREGSTFSVHVVLTRRAGFDEAVTLTVASIPGIALAAPASIARGAKELDLQIKVDRPPYGSAKVDVNATSGAFGGISRSISVQVAGKPGTLDYGLADGGVLVTQFTIYALLDAVVEDDGEIVALGSDSQSLGARIARFDRNGKLAASFGDGGIAGGPDAGGPSRSKYEAFRLVTAGDGGVTATGKDCSFPSPSDCVFWAARYTDTGKLEPSFGVGGAVATAVAGQAIVRDGDRVLVVGGGQRNGVFTPISTRLLANGAIDTTYADAGVAAADAGLTTGTQMNDAILRDGGFAYSLAQNNARELVTQIRADGTLDTSFASGVPQPSPISPGYPARLTSLPDGRLLATGAVGPSNFTGGYVVAYTPSGALDATFGDGGATTIPNVWFLHSAVFAGGAIYVATTLDPEGVTVRKLSLKGEIDPTFGTNGFLRYVPPSGPSRNATAILLVDPKSSRITVVTEEKIDAVRRAAVLMRFWY